MEDFRQSLQINLALTIQAKDGNGVRLIGVLRGILRSLKTLNSTFFANFSIKIIRMKLKSRLKVTLSRQSFRLKLIL